MPFNKDGYNGWGVVDWLVDKHPEIARKWLRGRSKRTIVRELNSEVSLTSVHKAIEILVPDDKVRTERAKANRLNLSGAGPARYFAKRRRQKP